MAPARTLLMTSLLVILWPSIASAVFGDTLFVAVCEELQSTFGWFVESAGDLDADGHNDIVVGDWTNHAGGSEAGRSYVYFTGLAADSTADIVVTGTADWQWCGRVQRAGDMNGDGRDDLAIGAPGYGGGRGRVFLFWGGNSFLGDVSAAAADVKITGASALNPDRLGYDIEPLGDVNQDGFDDLLISTGDYSGLAYAFFGDSTLSGVVPATMADVTFDLSPELTLAVDAGDFNGDSRTDVVLGTCSAVYVFLGDSTGFGTTLTAADADAVITESNVGGFGCSLACDGDLDGDGYDDLAVGWQQWIAAGDTVEVGSILLFYGRSSPPPTMTPADADWIVGGSDGDIWVGQLFGDPVFGDQDGDGYHDLIVPGHAWKDPIEGQLGRAYLFVGSAARRSGITYTWQAEHIWTGPPPSAGFGRGAAWIPDAIPGSTGVFAFGATANWKPDLPGKVYVIDAGGGWTPPVGAGIECPSTSARLLACAPTPFASATTVRFELPRTSRIDLAVYDVAGRRVRTLQSGPREAGAHTLAWDRTNSVDRRIGAGVYFVRLKGEGLEDVRRVVALD